jgi:hypothetical protein
MMARFMAKFEIARLQTQNSLYAHITVEYEQISNLLMALYPTSGIMMPWPLTLSDPS